MKMTTEHYSILRAGFTEILPQLKEHALRLSEDNRVKDLPKRVRWDGLSGLCRTSYIPQNFLCGTLYTYLNDEHIDTALRAIAKELDF